MNPECELIQLVDFNDCAHAAGGRGRATREWCHSCLSVHRVEIADLLESLRRFPGTSGVERNTLAALWNLAHRVSALEQSARLDKETT